MLVKSGWLKYLWVSSLGILLLLGCEPKTQSQAPSYNATVDRVVDGDTIRLKQDVLGTRKVRLLSIDAPELHYQNQAQNPWAKQAKDFLENLIPPGTQIQLQTDQDAKDAYGRLLAHIRKGKIDINKEMLRKGHAVTYYIYPNLKHFKSYQAAYLDAKEKGKGMWDSTNPIPELPFEFRDRVSGQSQDKYVGDFEQKQYVSPEKYKQIQVEKRVFFLNEEDAIQAGYQKRNK
ncbi:thermonuclease family protein [Thermoflavimicrobium daqui]|jgi:endonuclease YncB( thermonuclease family)|uniref:TNase-like domain-containing protein n=1 Tax=Thermoflavimicrobium daqui TaxID=2137476 RepID=A0A364K2M6_9BACL|nr:thermonuclease family protein [Thermoflavimicrobium daqui]RAL22591.1 hypothetical protein DL897_14370 [Thermoflavimicrobium daqui]